MAEDKGNKARDADIGRDEQDLGAGPEDGKIRPGSGVVNIAQVLPGSHVAGG